MQQMREICSEPITKSEFLFLNPEMSSEKFLKIYSIYLILAHFLGTLFFIMMFTL